MRLINARTFELEEFSDKETRPKYAILSHTWTRDEVTFNDMRDPHRRETRQGFKKIQHTCRQAIEHDCNYAWVDTCCIDKSNSAELSEAINSMYKWYREGSRCYAYLEGITIDHVAEYRIALKSEGSQEESSTMNSPFKQHRWFTRGWTLQELIAPARVDFYGMDWVHLGSSFQLLDELVSITGISKHALKPFRKRAALATTTVAQKMSWAAKRKTTRVEDQAYCLLGIFGVHMPLLYGEGNAAFIRLQEEIIRVSSDQSIFAWSMKKTPESSGHRDMLLAPSPMHFEDCASMVHWNPMVSEPFQMTNVGVSITLPIVKSLVHENYFAAVLSCGYANDKGGAVALPVRVVAEDQKSVFHVTTSFGQRTIVLGVKATEKAIASCRKNVHLQRSGSRWPVKLFDEYESAELAANKRSTIWMDKAFGSLPQVSPSWKLKLEIHKLLPAHRWRQSAVTEAHVTQLGPRDQGGAVIIKYRHSFFAMTFGFEKRNWHREAPSLWVNFHELRKVEDLDELIAQDEREVLSTSIIREIPNGNEVSAKPGQELHEIYGFATRKIGYERTLRPRQFPDDCVSVKAIPLFAMGELRFELAGKTSEECVNQERANVRRFHQNLDAGKFSTIGSLLAPDYYWNYDGNIILTAQAGAATLQGFATSALNGLHAQDIYNIVDGNQAAVLFRISGKQTGPFVGLPLHEDGRFNGMSAETFTFNAEAAARHVVTCTPVGIMKEQMQGHIQVADVKEEVPKQAKKKDSEYKNLVKQRLVSVHLNAKAGDVDAIAKLAAENVEVNENDSVTSGKGAFVRLVTAQNAGGGSLPNKLFHDFDILVDGNFGAVNYVWQAPQASGYNGIAVREGASVRMRSTLFFELNDEGLVMKATGVYDESVVNATLTGTGYLFP